MTLKKITIKRDGETLHTCDTANAAHIWLHKHQGQSVHHAIRWEGYTIEEEEIAPCPHCGSVEADQVDPLSAFCGSCGEDTTDQPVDLRCSYKSWLVDTVKSWEK